MIRRGWPGSWRIPVENPDSPESRRIALALARQVDAGADPAQIADTIISIWHEIDGALHPIVGQRGVASLYRRSLHLTSPAYPWLAGLQDDIQAAMDLAALRSVLVQQSSANAAASGGDLLQTFHELLASLVGDSLTERLLRSIWAMSTSLPAQDTPR
jgi:hypothetical protein